MKCRVDHDRNFMDKKQRTDVRKYSFVNRTIENWNQLPAEACVRQSNINFLCEVLKFQFIYVHKFRKCDVNLDHTLTDSSSLCGHTESSCGAVRSPLTRKSFNVSNPKSYALLPTPLGMSPTSNCILTLVYHSSQRRSRDPPSCTTAGWLDIATSWLLPCLCPPTLPGS